MVEAFGGWLGDSVRLAQGQIRPMLVSRARPLARVDQESESATGDDEHEKAEHRRTGSRRPCIAFVEFRCEGRINVLGSWPMA